ncbi:MAG TPA: sulfur carrier protein ThiS [Methylocella sp.]|jgi:sulfur carrier protein|nr:sulfur carrier protein ThiS [Methylocella sp.]
MQIHVNGKALEVAAATLAALLLELEYEEGAVATALNQNFVRKSDRGKTSLKEGDAVEILTPRQGG